MLVRRAADVLIGGGVVAYPTEGVFGLGCMPDNAGAVRRILEIKRRHPDKGLILIAARPSQFRRWTDDRSIPLPDPSRPVTWIVEASESVLDLVTGNNPGIAVRITTHPVAAALCDAVDSPIVSTSANLSGRKTARNRFVLQRQFGTLVDLIVPGDCGPASGPSEIRELATGKVLRAGSE